MRETDLNNKLNSYKAPEPSDLLKARILRVAQADGQATESPARISFTKRFMPIAASLLAVCAIGFATLQVTSTTTKTETAAWQEAALNLGFEDVYNWVETETAPTEGS